MMNWLLHCYCYNYYSGADITATDTKSNTPLLLAASAGHIEAFTELLSKGAAIDVEDEDRQTALHLAAKENHVKILQVSIVACMPTVWYSKLGSQIRNP